MEKATNRWVVHIEWRRWTMGMIHIPGAMGPDGKGFCHAPQNSAQFKIYKLLIPGIFHVIPSCLKKYFIYLFLERGEGREKQRERNITVWLPLMCPTTQACALPGNGTCDPLVHRPGTQTTEPHQPGLHIIFASQGWPQVTVTVESKLWIRAMATVIYFNSKLIFIINLVMIFKFKQQRRVENFFFSFFSFPRGNDCCQFLLEQRLPI